MSGHCYTRHHLIIAGTGRAGTSLLVKILSACGLDTELDRGNGPLWYEPANAGIETLPLTSRELPYVLKSPWAYQFLDELIYRKEVILDGLIVPMRDLREATASRVIIELQNLHRTSAAHDELLIGWRDWGVTPGGITYSLEPLDQARILGQSLHLLLEKALEYEIPIALVKFPKFARDPAYLYRTLEGFIAGKVDRTQFEEIFRSIVSPEQIRVSTELDHPKNGHAVVETQAADAKCLPLLEELENIALKRELRSKRLEIAHTSTELSALTNRCANLQAELATALSKAAVLPCVQDSAIAKLRAELEERAAAQANLRVEIEQRAATEANLRAEIEQRAATEVNLRAEIEQRAATEAELRAEVEQHASTEAALRAQVEQRASSEAALRSAHQEDCATTEALRTELEGVRSRLLEAQWCHQQNEAATAVLKDQISSMQSELDAAREAGTATLKALRYDLAMPPDIPRSPGWRRLVMRCFGRPAPSTDF